MTNYNDEIYKFLATEENMEGLIIAKNQFEIVKKRLILEFWEAVKKAIEVDVVKESKDWKVCLQLHELNSGASHPKLYFYNSSQNICINHKLPSFMYCIEPLNRSVTTFGFWVNNVSEYYDHIKLLDFVKGWNEKLKLDYLSKPEWYPLYILFEELDFSIETTLLKLVPEKRKNYIEIIVKTVSSFYEQTSDGYIELLKNKELKINNM